MLNDPRGLAENVSIWLRSFMSQASKDTFVLGVSGGLDSAVAFRLAQMTGLRIQPIFLPKHVAQAERIGPRVKELLGTESDRLITNEIEMLSWIRPLVAFTDEQRKAKAIGNFHARIRMATLYYYAELFGGIVLGTTNLPEWHVGYFTKWGDGAVDCEPLRSLLKEEVYQLGREGFDVPVPDSILDVAPSAELWNGQTDEDEMGFTYADIDAFLDGRDGVSSEVVAKIQALHEATGHKRRESPHFTFIRSQAV